MDACEREQEIEILRRMSARRKLDVMTGLVRTAYSLKAAALRAQHPHLPEKEIQARVRVAVGGGGPGQAAAAVAGRDPGQGPVAVARDGS